MKVLKTFVNSRVFKASFFVLILLFISPPYTYATTFDVRIFYVQAFPQRFWLEFTEDGLIEVNRELADKSDWGKSGLWIDAYFAGVGYDPPIEIWRYSFSGIMIDPLMVMGFGKLEHTRIGEPSPLPFFFIGSAMK